MGDDIDAEASDILEKSEAINKLLHDLHGPVLNARRFHEEMAEAIARIQALLPTGDASVTPALIEEIKELTDEDLAPCQEHAAMAVEQLYERVKMFEKIFDK